MMKDVGVGWLNSMRIECVLLFVAVIFLMLCGCSITGQFVGTAVSDCSLASRMDFLRIGDDIQSCYGGDSIYFAVENTGFDDFSGIYLEIVGDYNITMKIIEDFSSGALLQKTISFGNQRLSGVKYINVYPIIKKTGSVCRSAAIRSDIRRCY